MTPKQAARLAIRSGCKLKSSRRLPDGRWAFEITCSSHEARVQLLANLAAWDAGAIVLDGEYAERHAEVIDLARELTAGIHSDADRAEILMRYVQDRVRWIDEPRELFTDTMKTLERASGDCDDSARALAALYYAVGLSPAMGTLGDPPRHVAAKVHLFGRWYWAETTLPAHFGEHPVAALQRLGPAYDYRKDVRTS